MIFQKSEEVLLTRFFVQNDTTDDSDTVLGR